LPPVAASGEGGIRDVLMGQEVERTSSSSSESLFNEGGGIGVEGFEGSVGNRKEDGVSFDLDSGKGVVNDGNGGMEKFGVGWGSSTSPKSPFNERGRGVAAGRIVATSGENGSSPPAKDHDSGRSAG